MLNDWAGLVEARVMIRAFVVVLSVGLAHPAWADDAPGVCGDGVVDSGEQCDEGGDTATCNANCTLPTCGDGYLNLVAGEECDDGNHATGDGCTATCHVESGYSCVDAVGLPIDCVTICGDGIVAGAEACDDGNTRDGDGCSATCGVEVGWLCSGTACAAICGDGIQVGGEECDDGNSQTGDGCTPACTSEFGWSSSGGSNATTCGDGIVAGNEQCDDGNQRSGDGCSASCMIEPAPACATPACGTEMPHLGSDDAMTDASDDEPTALARTGGCNATGTDGSVLLVLGALVAARRRKRC